MANIIREAVSNIAGVFASGFDTLIQEFGDPDRLSLKAKPSPAWDGTSGIMAYGECPQIAGHTGDKTWLAKVFVPEAAFCVFGEAAAGRITCTPSGSGWKAGGIVFTADGTATLLSAELPLSTVDPTYIAVTYDAATGETKLFLAGVEENDTTFGEARNTVEALPIWRVGAPPEGWVTDFAVFDRILAPEEMPGFVAPVAVTINQGSGQADPTAGSSIVFDVVFAEAVTGFATGDVTLTAGTAPGTLVGTVAGSGTTYTVTVTGMTGAGTVVATIAAGVCTAVSDGRPNAASTSTDNTVTVTGEPDDILGGKLLAWYDADDPANITVGVADVVTQWSDKVGTFDLINGGQPTWISNAYNGRDIIRFDGVDDYLWNPSAFMFANGTIEIWIVLKSDESGLGHVINEGSTGLANYVYRIYDDDSNNDYVFNLENNAGTGRIVNAQDRSTNDWDLIIATDLGAATGSSMEVVDVDAGTTGAYTRDTPSPALNRFSIGAKITSSPASSFFDGDMAEVLILSTAASSGERAALAAYFNAKYGENWSPA